MTSRASVAAVGWGERARGYHSGRLARALRRTGCFPLAMLVLLEGTDKVPVSLNSVLCFFVAGLFFILPCTDNFIKVDMRTISFDIPPQEVRWAFAINNRGHV